MLWGRVPRQKFVSKDPVSHYFTEEDSPTEINVIICLFIGSTLMLINISGDILSTQCLLKAED